MSTRRVKAIDYDDDDLEADDYDYEDGDQNGGQEELTDDDKEQMRIGTAKVREALGSTSASDQEIQEALWHYYYDVAQSVSYLKSKPR
jgi:elongation factor 1 alpha-like protein